MIDIKPIKTEADYEAALAEVGALMDVEPGTPESDRLDILATLVEAYEDKHFPIGDPDPIAAIEHRMEALGLDANALGPIVGGNQCAAEILTRRQPLTLEMIRHLHERLRISADVLIQPYKLDQRAS